MSSSRLATNDLDPPPEKMPGHWLLARMGKRVLRPGGLELTGRLLAALRIGTADHVVEFAPGLGITAGLVLERRPKSYTAVERDPAAAEQVRQLLADPRYRCVVGSAEDSGLPAGDATVVYGEAMLSMQPQVTKDRIVAEAARLLRPRGRYGIHELCLVPDELDLAVEKAICRDLSDTIHVGVRPLTVARWRALLASHGFEVTEQALAPMHLLEPLRVIRDEGWWGAIRFFFHVFRSSAARQRVRAMLQAFRRHRANMAAILLVGRKREESAT